MKMGEIRQIRPRGTDGDDLKAIVRRVQRKEENKLKGKRKKKSMWVGTPK